MAETKLAVVVGGGISGLACAFRLHVLGVPVMVLEADERAGGLLGTSAKDGFLFESGPQSFQGTDSLLDLVRELGIESELLQANPQAPRFVLRHGKPQKIPMSPPAMLSSSLLSLGSRLKIASEPLRRTKPPSEEESVARFVRRKFGHEILEYLVAPFVSGVYAGDPEKLSLKAAFPTLDEWEREYGSVLRGAMKSRSKKSSGPPPLCSFEGGIDTLTRAMAGKLGSKVRAGARVKAIGKVAAEKGTAPYEIVFDELGQELRTSAHAVILACPAYVASHIVDELSSPLAHTLSGIAYAPVAVVAAGYYKQQISQTLEGFGVLVPRSEKYRVLGTVWNSSLFSGRAPEGNVAITSFVGGATDQEIIERTDEEIASIVHQENSRILGITGNPVVTAVWKHPKALPQYNLGHGHTVETLKNAERKLPGLYFSGNYLEGPSIGKCTDHSFQTAEAVRDYFRSRT